MVTIYAFRCIASGAAYVGMTTGKIGKRAREHRCMCRTAKHHSAKLMEEWQKHGESSFEMVTLEALSEDSSVNDRRQAELRWIREYQAKGLLLNANELGWRPCRANIQKGIEAARGVAGNRWTPEANEKRRLSQLGKPKGHGAKISATKRAKRELAMR